MVIFLNHTTFTGFVFFFKFSILADAIFFPLKEPSLDTFENQSEFGNFKYEPCFQGVCSCSQSITNCSLIAILSFPPNNDFNNSHHLTSLLLTLGENCNLNLSENFASDFPDLRRLSFDGKCAASDSCVDYKGPPLRGTVDLVNNAFCKMPPTSTSSRSTTTTTIPKSETSATTTTETTKNATELTTSAINTMAVSSTAMSHSTTTTTIPQSETTTTTATSETTTATTPSATSTITVSSTAMSHSSGTATIPKSETTTTTTTATTKITTATTPFASSTTTISSTAMSHSTTTATIPKSETTTTTTTTATTKTTPLTTTSIPSTTMSHSISSTTTGTQTTPGSTAGSKTSPPTSTKKTTSISPTTETRSTQLLTTKPICNDIAGKIKCEVYKAAGTCRFKLIQDMCELTCNSACGTTPAPTTPTTTGLVYTCSPGYGKGTNATLGYAGTETCCDVAHNCKDLIARANTTQDGLLKTNFDVCYKVTSGLLFSQCAFSCGGCQINDDKLSGMDYLRDCHDNYDTMKACIPMLEQGYCVFETSKQLCWETCNGCAPDVPQLR